MNEAIELHDSEVLLAEDAGDVFRIVFSSAYIHRSLGQPGIDAGAGYTQQAELTFTSATWSKSALSIIGKLSDGFLMLSGKKHPLIPLPLLVSGKIEAELVFVSGAVLSISALSVSCKFTSEAHFVENYAG
ncbi:MAG: hypothetical protein ACXW1P_11040 [Methylophilaceae bacterium]